MPSTTRKPPVVYGLNKPASVVSAVVVTVAAMKDPPATRVTQTKIDLLAMVCVRWWRRGIVPSTACADSLLRTPSSIYANGTTDTGKTLEGQTAPHLQTRP